MDTPINTRYPQDVLEDMRKLAKAHIRSFNGEVIHALRGYIAQNRKGEKVMSKDAYQVTVRREQDLGRFIRFMNSLSIEWEPDSTEEGKDDTGTYYDYNFFADLSDVQKDIIKKAPYVITSYLGEE